MNRRLMILSAVAVALGAFALTQQDGLLYQIGRQRDVALLDGGTAVPAPAAAARRGPVKLNPLEGMEPQSFADISSHPLFNPGRAPRPAEAPPPLPPVTEEPPMEAPPPVAVAEPHVEDYRLLGIAEGPDGRIAALRVSATGDVRYLRQGEAIDAWTVLSVDARSVTIGDVAKSVVLNLFAEAEGSAAEAPAETPAVAPSQ